MLGLLLYIYSDINLNQPLCYFGGKGIVILFLSVPSCAPDIQNSMSKDQKYLNGFGSQISVTRGRALQKFLPEPIRTVSGEGAEGGLSVWQTVHLHRLKRPRPGNGVNSERPWENLDDDSINACFQVSVWDQLCAIV